MDIPILFDLGPTSSAQLGQNQHQNQTLNLNMGLGLGQIMTSKQGHQKPRTSNGSSLHTNGTVGNQTNNNNNNNGGNSTGGRKRSNSRSQVMSSLLPSASAAAAAASATVSGNSATNSVSSITPSREYPDKRMQMQYFVTLIPLNETFIKKNLLIPYYPETLKLGRPAGSKVKPEISNGYFDSRVLSRNHAAMFIDPENGKLMIKDLGSSNGTFVNELKIGLDPIELKIGDVIYLGFNIEVDTSHKKISARVENINIMPNYLRRTGPSLVGNGTNNGNNNNNNNNTGNSSAGSGKFFSGKRKPVSNELTGAELKHFDFIQSVFESQLLQNQQLLDSSGAPMSFENALFGDINPNLEDAMLGLNPKGGCGIFNNSQITNSANLEQTITILTNNLTKVRQQNSTLKSLEDFVQKYQSRLNEINQDYLDQQYKTKLREYEEKLADATSLQQKTAQEFDKYKIKKEQKVYQLEHQILKMKGDIDSLDMKVRASKLALKKADDIEQSRKRSVAENNTATDAKETTKEITYPSNNSTEGGASTKSLTNQSNTLPLTSDFAESASTDDENKASDGSKKLTATNTTNNHNHELNENSESETKSNEHNPTRGTPRDLLPPVSTPSSSTNNVPTTEQTFLSTPPSVPASLLPLPDIRDGIESGESRDNSSENIDNFVDRDRKNDSISVTPPVSDDEFDVGVNGDIVDARVVDDKKKEYETKLIGDETEPIIETGPKDEREPDASLSSPLAVSDLKVAHQQELVPLRTLAFVGVSVVLLYFIVNYKLTIY